MASNTLPFGEEKEDAGKKYSRNTARHVMIVSDWVLQNVKLFDEPWETIEQARQCATNELGFDVTEHTLREACEYRRVTLRTKRINGAKPENIEERVQQLEQQVERLLQWMEESNRGK